MKSTDRAAKSSVPNHRRSLPPLPGATAALLLLAAVAASAAPVQLTTSALNDVAPRWHPGGATIAYMKLDGGGNYQPGTVNINGTGEAFLATRVTRLYELWSELDPAAAREQSRAECQARVAALAEESRAHNWLHELH